MRSIKSLKELLFLVVIFLCASNSSLKEHTAEKSKEFSTEESSASESLEENQINQRIKTTYPSYVTPIRGKCYIDEKDSAAKRLSNNLKYFGELIKTAKFAKITQNAGIAEAIGELISKSKFTPEKVNSFSFIKKIGNTIAKLPSFKSVLLKQSSSTDFAKKVLKAKESLITDFLKSVESSIDDRIYNSFSKNAYLKYLRYTMQSEYLKYSNLDCVLEQDILFIDPINLFDNYSMSSTQNVSMFHPDECKEKITKNVSTSKVSGTDFDNDGIAFAFFHSQKLPELKKINSKTIFETFISNARQYSYSVYQKSNIIKNQIQISNRKLRLRGVDLPADEYDILNCGSLIFTFVSLQKEGTSYKLIISLRFPVLNKSFTYAYRMKAEDVENLTFNFNVPQVYRFDDFKYELENELKIMLYLSNKEGFDKQIRKDIDQCKSENCKYAENGKCLNCFDYEGLDVKFILHEGKCVVACPAGFFTDKIKRTCERCDKTCKTCDSKVKCTECSENYPYKQEEKCVRQCESGFFLDKKNKKCLKCSDNCEECSNLNVCTKCPAPLALNEDTGKCVTCKDAGLYLTTEKNILKCKKCFANCKKCKNFDSCDECNNKYASKENKQCVQCCGKGFYKDKNNKCAVCPGNCSECTAADKCTKCKNDKIKPVNGKCVSELKCDEGYSIFKDACHKCPQPNCSKCDFTPVKKCVQCDKKFFDKDGKCVTTCGIGFEETIDKKNDNARKCQKCPKNCDVCKDGVCIKCSKEKGLLNDVCTTCPSGYVLCGNVCMRCTNQNCDKCNCNNLKECTNCKSNMYLLQGTCVKNCPEKYFSSFTIDADNGSKELICKKCSEKCKKCVSETDCLQCENVSEQKVCKDKCSEGFKLTEVYSDKLNAKVKVCQECSVANCGTCENQENCDKCKSPFKLYANKCHRECPSGTFVVGKETCSDCIKDCLICKDKKTCDKCKNLIEEGKCVNNCSKGYYKKDNKCLPCPDEKCKDCLDNSGECAECKDKFVLLNKRCKKNCCEGFFKVADANICKACKSPCKLCKEKEDNCLSCINESMILTKDNKCVDECKDGQVETKDSKGKKMCLDCYDKENCLKCQEKNLEHCLVCKNFNQNGKCVDKCDQGFYSVTNENDKKCVPCLSNCKTCNDDKTCLECFDNLVLKDGNKCVNDCGTNYIQDKQSCVKCLNNQCEKCDLANLKCCTQCNDFLHECKCHQTCPAGTYIDKVTLNNGLTQKVCKNCEVNACSECSKEKGKKCDKCLAGYFLYKNKCEKKCPVGTVLSKIGNECIQCGVSNCDKCNPENSKDSCDKCKNGFFKKDINGKTECVQDCGAYYFKSINADKDLACERCGPNCIECDDENSCKLCESGLYSRKGKCQKCYEGYFIKAPFCHNCPSGCKSCLNKDTCIECFDGKYLFEGKCHNDCKPKYAKWDKKCEKCPSGCDICEKPDKCIECTTPKILNNGVCLDKCEEGSIEVKITDSKNTDDSKVKTKCVKCLTNNSCLKCSENDLAKCEQCKKDKVLQNEQCKDNCDEGYFENENKKCEKCSVNCKVCNNREKCLKCKDKFFLNDKNQCVENCADGFYPNTEGECIPCSKNCKKCHSRGCIECFADMKIQDKICVKECSETYFLEGKSKCEKCASNCLKCSDKKNCETCIAPKYPLNGICNDCKACDKEQEKCIPKVLHKATQKCLLCSDNCLTCDENDQSKCITCPKNKVLTTENRCEDKCTEGTFYKSEIEKCKNCLNSCLVCENEVSCNVCKPGLFLQPNQESCEPNCPIKFRKTDKGECQACSHPKCNECDSNEDICKTCEPNMFLLNGRCLEECPAGFYSDLERNCLKCDKKCAECISEKQCTRCVNENDSLHNFECKDKCPEGSVSIYVTEENKDKSTKKIKKCKKCTDEKCSKCEAANLDNCLECKANQLLIENKIGSSKCVNNCPAKYFEVKTTRRCEKCSENCKKCEDEKTCKKCETGLLENGVCVESCSKGYYQKGEECLKCEAQNCSICSAKEPTRCKACDDKFVLKNNECHTKCGDKYYEVNSEDLGKSCKPCILNCKTCTNDLECKECVSPKYISGLNKICVDCKENSGSVIIGKECYNCQINNCAKCPADISRLGECEKCLTGFYVTPNGKCEADCPVGFYKNKENGKCVKCLEEKCSICNPENNCEACKDNLVLQNGKCEKECNIGFYENENKICKPCGDEKCAVCDKKNNDKCITCKDPFALKLEFAIENIQYGTCVKECDKGYFKDSKNNCDKCSEGCLNCTTFDTCLECDIDNKYFLKEGKCQTKCGINYTVINGECKRCTDPKCNYCAVGDKDKCIDCTPYPRRNDKCVEQCDDETYLNNETYTCENCTENCIQCDDKLTCNKCQKGFVLQENKCVKKCSISYKLNEDSQVCEKCSDSSCLNCNNKKDECITCAQGKVLLKGKCENNCPSNYFRKESKIGVICEKCPCKACENENQCTKCDEDKVLHDGKCLDVCPDRLYAKINQNSGVRECVPCANSSCLKCSEVNPEICTVCPEGKRNYFNKKENKLECLDSCRVGTFEELTIDKINKSSKVNCIDCVSPCVQCKSRTECTKCLKEFSLHDGKCESECPSGFTKNDEGHCVSCGGENCAKCPANNLNKCLECQKGYLFPPTNTCKTECPENYRGADNEDGKKICVPCPANCKKCDEKECKQCAKDFYFLHNTNECGTCNTFNVIVNKNRCVKCEAENCLICEEAKPNHCKQCKSNYVNIDGKCQKNCPEGFYKDENITCQPCNPECKTCTDKDACVTCKGDQAIITDDGKCTDKCPPKFVAVEGKCKQCPVMDCNICDRTDLKTCKVCLDNYFLYNNKCVKECKKGTRSSVITFENTSVNVCFDCPIGCSECNENQCTRCDYELGFYMQNGVCVKQCHVGYYLDVTEKNKVKTGVCVKCSGENCLECDKDKCTKCTPDTFEYYKDGKLTCINSCPEKTYLNNEQKKCFECSKNCKSCISEYNCKKCDNEYILYKEAYCLEECPLSYTKVNNGETGFISKCVQCKDPYCEKCQINDASKCVECAKFDSMNKPLVLNDKDKTCQIKKDCKKGQFFDNQSGKCEECPADCEECISNRECTSCKNNKIPVDGSCYITCPPKRVEINKKCIPCEDSKCLKCATDLKTCFKCEEPSMFYQNKCYATCPEGSCPDPNKKNECITCPYNCKTCKSDKECSSCSDGFFFLNSNCINPCPNGFFGTCDKNTCNKCHESCKICKGKSENDCIECAEGYYKLGNKCVRKEECPKGTYPSDLPKRECKECNKFCKECSGPDQCVCINKFKWDSVSKQCVYAFGIYNLYDDSLFSFYTNQNKKFKYSLQKDAKGIAVSYTQVSFTFWMRLVKELFYFGSDNLNVLTFNSQSKIEFGINKNGDCELKYTSNDSKTKSQMVSIKEGCTYEKLYNYRHFGVVLGLEDKTFNLGLYYEIDSKKFESSIIKFKTPQEDLVTVESDIQFNPIPHNSVFQITSFSIKEYNPFTYSTYDDFVNKKPFDCDFNCKTCINSQCTLCAEGEIFDTNGKAISVQTCPAAYVHPHASSQIITGKVLRDIKDILKEKLIEKPNYVSDTYSFGGWFYVSNLTISDNQFDPFNYLTTTYENAKDNLIKDIFNIDFVDKNKVSVNGEIADIIPIKEKYFYYIMVGVSVDKVTVWTSTKHDTYEMVSVINKKGVAGKLFQDLSFNIADNNTIKSLFQTRFYFNNIPEEKFVIKHINTLQLDEKCEETDELMKCIKCKNNLVLRDGVCEPQAIVHVLSDSMFNLIEKTTKEFDVEKHINEDYDKKFTFSFFIRRKNLPLSDPEKQNQLDNKNEGVEKEADSTNNKPFTLFSLYDRDEHFTNLISIRNHNNDYNMDILFRISDKEYYRVIYNESQTDEFSFIKFVVSIDKESKQINYFFGDNRKKIKMRKITASISNLIDNISFNKFGDNSANEILMELVWPKFQSEFYSNEEDELIKIYKDPNLCGFGCVLCDYNNPAPKNQCISCYNNKKVSKKTGQCPNILSGFKYVKQYESLEGKSADKFENSNELSSDDHLRLTKLDSVTDLGFFDQNVDLESTSNSYSVTGTVLFYEDLFVDNTIEFNVFALNNFREKTNYKLKSDMNVNGVNFLRMDIVKASNSTVRAIIKLKYDYADSTLITIDENIILDINRWVAFYVKVSKKTLYVVFEYPNKERVYKKVFEKNIQLKYQPVSVTELTSIVKNFGRYKTKLNMAALFIYLIPNDNQDNFFETIKTRNSVTRNYKHFDYQECKSNCRVCSQLFDDPKNPNGCLECFKSVQNDPVFVYEGECKRRSETYVFTYQLLLDSYLNDLFQYEIPNKNYFANNNDNYDITFYFRRNYLPQNYQKRAVFFEIGDISLSISSTITSDSLVLIVPNDVQEEKVLDITTDLSNTWFQINLKLNANSITFTANKFVYTGIEKTSISTKSFKINHFKVKSLLGSKIRLNNLNNRITIHTLRLDTDKIHPHLNVLPVSDRLGFIFHELAEIVETKNQTIPEDFYLINNRRNRYFIEKLLERPKLNLDDKSMPYRVAFADLIQPSDKLFIGEDFQISFDLKLTDSEAKLFKSNKAINILKINNNPRSSISLEEPEQQATNIISLIMNSQTKFTLQLGNKLEFVRNGNKPSEISLNLPNDDLTNKYYKIYITKTSSSSKRIIRIMIFNDNTSRNYIYQEIPIETNHLAYDRLTNAASIYFFDNEHSVNKGLIANIRDLVIKPKFDNILDTKRKMQINMSMKTQNIQDVCEVGDEVCEKCEFGVLKNGICLPDINSVLLISNKEPIFLKISESSKHSILRNITLNDEINNTPINKYSFSFSFKKFFFDGTKISPMINIFNDNKVIFSMYIDHKALRFTNHLAKEQYESNINNGELLLPEHHNPYLHPLREFYVNVNVDLEAKRDEVKIFMYQYDQKYQNTEFTEVIALVDYSNAQNTPKSFTPNNLQYNLGSDINAVTPNKNNIDSYFHSLIFNPNFFMPSNEEQKYRVRFSGICDVPCKVLCGKTNGICPVDKLIEKHYDLSMDKYGRTKELISSEKQTINVYSMIPLVRRLRDSDLQLKSPTYTNEFLLKFDVSLSDFMQVNQGNYNNKNVLFVISNDKVSTWKLTMADKLPEDFVNKALLSAQFEFCKENSVICQHKLIFKMGYFNEQNPNKQYIVYLTPKQITKLSVVIYVRSEIKSDVMVQYSEEEHELAPEFSILIKENNKITSHRPNLNQFLLASLLSTDSGIHSHPSLRSFSVDMVSPNINNEFYKMIKEKSIGNESGNLCSQSETPNPDYFCQTCLQDTCLKCSEKSFLNERGFCMKKNNDYRKN